MTVLRRRPAWRAALVATAIGYALSAWVAFMNAPRASELGYGPADALARGLVAEGMLAWQTRVGPTLLIVGGVLALIGSVFGSYARLAIVRAGVFGEPPVAAYTLAVRSLVQALLARLALLIGGAVLVVITSLPLVVLFMLWSDPIDARLHDLTVLGLCTLPLFALFVITVIDDLIHAAIIVHGPRALEALVLSLRALHRRAFYASTCAGLFVLGARVLIVRIAMTTESGLYVAVVTFTLLCLMAVVRAELLTRLATEVWRSELRLPRKKRRR